MLTQGRNRQKEANIWDKNARCMREDVRSRQCRSWHLLQVRDAEFLTTNITQRVSTKNICAFLRALQPERYM